MKNMRAMAMLCGLVLLAAFAAYVAVNKTIDVPLTQAGPVVRVTMERGQGSGVHIGRGYILTAAHVIGKETTAKIVDDRGITRKGEVLWVNTVYDVALVRIERTSRLSFSPLACGDIPEGTSLVARGSPLGVEFISFRGWLSGKTRSMGPWKSVVVMDISGGPGISGGPVYDAKNRVIAIFVGARIAPVGMGGSYVGMSFGVPSSVICDLMARGV